MEKRLQVHQKSLQTEQTRAEVYALNQLYCEVERRLFEEYAARHGGIKDGGCSDGSRPPVVEVESDQAGCTSGNPAKAVVTAARGRARTLPPTHSGLRTPRGQNP